MGLYIIKHDKKGGELCDTKPCKNCMVLTSYQMYGTKAGENYIDEKQARTVWDKSI